MTIAPHPGPLPKERELVITHRPLEGDSVIYASVASVRKTPPCEPLPPPFARGGEDEHRFVREYFLALAPIFGPAPNFDANRNCMSSSNHIA